MDNMSFGKLFINDIALFGDLCEGIFLLFSLVYFYFYVYLYENRNRIWIILDSESCL
ncbi:hypothetical protein IX318_000078 [Porphyromonas levii]|nr:hypothetical protein [Porphyromonas levii]MBR8714243.1 hypothetical protein [Porphyromonas levii]MBR8726785.1 hypothetical protein [Porphyromonas levii]MBR8735090.1 hypothetical protein [Porphyromonas levii]MBR8777193.1 hypothetical protein [Porphyromonas levii]